MLLFSTNPNLSGIAGHVQQYSLDNLPILERDNRFSFLLAFSGPEITQEKEILKLKLAGQPADLILCLEEGTTPESNWSIFSFSLPSIADNFVEKTVSIFRSTMHKAWIIIRTDLLEQLIDSKDPWWEQGIAISTIYQQKFQKAILDYAEKVCSEMNKVDPASSRDAREKKRMVSHFKMQWAELAAAAFFERQDHQQRSVEVAESILRAEERAKNELEYHVGNEPAVPAVVRTSSTTPLTNLRLVASLVADSKVSAVFDPYLDNKGLAVLGDIFSLGVSTSKNLRLLTAMKSPGLTITVFKAWLTEHGFAGEIRRMPKTEHGRFILLENGKSIRIGTSLNGLTVHNEAGHLDDGTEDAKLFEAIWLKSEELQAAEKATAVVTDGAKQQKVKRILQDWKIWNEDENARFSIDIAAIHNDMAERNMLRSGIFIGKMEQSQTEHAKLVERAKIKFSRDLEDLGYSEVEALEQLQN